jgi:hypothetical protein
MYYYSYHILFSILQTPSSNPSKDHTRPEEPAPVSSGATSSGRSERSGSHDQDVLDSHAGGHTQGDRGATAGGHDTCKDIAY